MNLQRYEKGKRKMETDKLRAEAKHVLVSSIFNQPESRTFQTLNPGFFLAGRCDMEEPDLLHFRSIPWCSALLADPSFTITPTFARQFKESTEDSLIAETLHSPNAISHCLSAYRTPHDGQTWIEETRTFLKLGKGMNGGPNLLHGGMIATILDEAMGLLLTINKDDHGGSLSGDTVTAKLDIRYMKPIFTPGTVMAVARCRKREGRKFRQEAWIEDSDGTILARADALWISIRRREEKL
jgi:acyl-coenzyme A thioesterase PaaI-like protein